AGFRLIGKERETWVGGEFQHLECEGQVADQRMVELLAAGAMELHVVPRPSHAEVLAPRGQLADEVGQGAVVRVAPCLGAQDRHGVPSGFLPIDPYGPRTRIEEREASEV